MNDSGFKEWLLVANGLAEPSAATRLSDVRRIEKHFGDLDQAWAGDKFAGILAQLAYSAADRDADKPNASGLVIDGDIYCPSSEHLALMAA